MLRRNVTLNTNETLQQGGPPFRSSSASSGRPRRTVGDGLSSSPICSVRFLLILAALITLANYFFPEEVALVEHEMAQDIYNAEQFAEHVVMDFWGDSSHPLRPIPEHEHPDFAETSEQATKRMMEQDSKWVDGEKKLKVKLKVLAQRQAEGKDIGVPVLTRYLGEDIPAWPSEGMDEKTWRAKVDAKYAEMRKEEEKWKAKMHDLLKPHQHG